MGTLASAEASAVSKEEVERLRRDLGLLDPLYVQYGRWLWATVRGNLGYSYMMQSSVARALVQKVPVSLTLAVLAVALAVFWAIPLGIISALKRGSWLDNGIRIFTAVGIALPNFWVAILVLVALVQFFNWSPPVKYVSIFKDPAASLSMFIFPALVIGYRQASLISRMTRSMMLEVIHQDYVRTARAKGLRGLTVVMRHALPNASLPVLTISATVLAALIEGAVVIEVVFNLPGLGRLIQQAVFQRDYALVQGIVMALGVLMLLWILIVDMLYGWLDPRIRYR